MDRPSKDEYYLNIARDISKRSTCLRRHFGAIIVLNDASISMGYNGSVRGAPNCKDIGYCLKDKYDRPEGKGYDVCRTGPLHAEVNAIINAARNGAKVLEAVMYIDGEKADGSHTFAYPCKSCQKVIINSGIELVIIRTDKGIEKLVVKKWVKEADHNEDKDIKGYY